ncbi:MAG TPA: alpha/beta hydrolase-fold protein [Chloroflexota bacterium]|nr:alpha/beta hydrolase-fold protein [Chloroflexota bacterium]
MNRKSGIPAAARGIWTHWPSGAIVLAVSLCATAGWAGAAVLPASAAQTADLPVRDRAAWQPSPVPSHATGATPAESAPATQRTARALAVSAPAAAPASLPGGVLPLSSQLVHERVEAMAGGPGRLPDQRGEWRTVTFYSRSLDREMDYLAWVPPGYKMSGARYPSLYLLHGVGSAAAYGVEEWLGYALTEDLDRMLALGLIDPMVVILPNGEQSFWVNHAGGGARWGDYVAEDLVTHVDATFRTTATRETRAIGGLSMGGHGALQLALNYPDTFGVAGAHSPTLRPYEKSPEFFGDPAYFAAHDPLSLAAKATAAKGPVVWIDVGDHDSWRGAAEQLARTLAARGAPVTARVLEGEHEGWYWRTYLPEYLRFYSAALTR